MVVHRNPRIRQLLLFTLVLVACGGEAGPASSAPVAAGAPPVAAIDPCDEMARAANAMQANAKLPQEVLAGVEAQLEYKMRCADHSRGYSLPFRSEVVFRVVAASADGTAYLVEGTADVHGKAAGEAGRAIAEREIAGRFEEMALTAIARMGPVEAERSGGLKGSIFLSNVASARIEGAQVREVSMSRIDSVRITPASKLPQVNEISLGRLAPRCNRDPLQNTIADDPVFMFSASSRNWTSVLGSMGPARIDPSSLFSPPKLDGVPISSLVFASTNWDGIHCSQDFERQITGVSVTPPRRPSSRARWNLGVVETNLRQCQSPQMELSGRLSADGRIDGLSVVRSSGNEIVDRAVLDMTRKVSSSASTIRPAREGQVPVSSDVRVSVFLRHPESSCESNPRVRTSDSGTRYVRAVIGPSASSGDRDQPSSEAGREAERHAMPESVHSGRSGEASRAMDAGDGRIGPAVIRIDPPRYPRDELGLCIGGRTLVRATIDSSGRVVDVGVLEGSGSESLDRAAMKAVEAGSFSAATISGRAVESDVGVPITFTPPCDLSNSVPAEATVLNDDFTSEPSRPENSPVNESQPVVSAHQLAPGWRFATISDPDGFTNVRSAPNGSAPIIGRVLEGQRFKVEPSTGDWWKVEVDGLGVGYMHRSRIALGRSAHD